MNNVMHDIYYQYGFDEAAGNFQNDNYGRGGKEGDNCRKINNAHFFTPPDGENPRMTMDIWKRTSPSRDSAFDNDIIAHEYTHGLSNRLTGGPKSSSCLGRYETGGMGEGWGDFFGAWLLSALDKMTTNPMTYGWVYGPKASEVHVIGTLWSNILYQMYWNLVDKIGFNNDKYSADITKGSTLTAQLIIDGMKLQPCRPTFVSARDAILQGEQQITGGKHQCEIWAAFAKRGVGVKATTDGKCKHLEVPRSGEPKTEVPKPEVPKPKVQNS
ncbi:peptidase M36 [Syncephalis fuscata]|nr:peptidase M36 [Syncephalis fuscata]